VKQVGRWVVVLVEQAKVIVFIVVWQESFSVVAEII
jgi:hypothetical protein